MRSSSSSTERARGKRHHAGPAGLQGGVGGAVLADPAEQQAAACRVVQGAGGVEVRAVVDALAPPREEAVVAVVADQGDGAAVGEQHHVAVPGREEVGHQPAFAGDRALAERVQVLPGDQVGRAVQEGQAGRSVLVGAAEQQVPGVAFTLRVRFASLTPDMRIVPGVEPGAELLRRVGQDRVAGMLAPVDEVVGSGGQALAQTPYAILERERFAHQPGVEDGRHAIDDDRAAAPAAVAVRPGRARRQRRRQVLPVQQVGADRVAPFGIAAERAHVLGVVLVEEVVAPAVMDRAVGVLDPPGGRQEVEARPVAVVDRGRAVTLR